MDFFSNNMGIKFYKNQTMLHVSNTNKNFSKYPQTYILTKIQTCHIEYYQCIKYSTIF